MNKILLKDLFKYTPAKVLPCLAGIIALAITTHLLNPEEYGNYILITIGVSFLSAISISWISSSAIRFFPIYKLEKNVLELLIILFRLLLLSTVITLFVSVIVFNFTKSYLPPNFFWLMLLGLSMFTVLAFYETCLGILRADRKAIWYSTFTTIHSIVTPLFGISFIILLQYRMEGLLLGTIVSTLIILPFLWKMSLRTSIFKKISMERKKIMEIIKYGTPSIVINVFTLITSLSDRYILKLFINSSAVGIYSANYSISERSIFLINSLVLLASTPIGCSIWEKKGARAGKIYTTKLTRYYFILAFPTVVILSVLAKPIVQLLIATDYHQGYKIIPLVALGAFLVGVAHRFTLGLVFHKRTDLLMYCYVGAGALSIILNIFLIPRYGYIIAAVNTLIAYAFFLLLTILVSKKLFSWKFPYLSVVKIIFSALVPGVLVHYLGTNLTSHIIIKVFIPLLVYTIIYSTLLFLFKEIKIYRKNGYKLKI